MVPFAGLFSFPCWLGLDIHVTSENKTVDSTENADWVEK